MCVCVCACACVCVRSATFQNTKELTEVCVRERERVCVSVCLCVCLCARGNTCTKCHLLLSNRGRDDRCVCARER